MKIAADALTVLFLLIIILQDLRERQISWVLLPLLFCSLLISALCIQGAAELGRSLLFNITFLTLQFLVLLVYYRIRGKRLKNIIDQYIGLGDILFLIVLTCAFSPVNFILFYVGSLLLSLAGFAIYRVFNKAGNPTLPLAATISMCLLAIVGTQYCTNLNIYDDAVLLSMLNSIAA